MTRTKFKKPFLRLLSSLHVCPDGSARTATPLRRCGQALVGGLGILYPLPNHLTGAQLLVLANQRDTRGGAGRWPIKTYGAGCPGGREQGATRLTPPWSMDPDSPKGDRGRLHRPSASSAHRAALLHLLYTRVCTFETKPGKSGLACFRTTATKNQSTKRAGRSTELPLPPQRRVVSPFFFCKLPKGGN